MIYLPRKELNTDSLRSLIQRYNLDSAELGLSLPEDVAAFGVATESQAGTPV